MKSKNNRNSILAILRRSSMFIRQFLTSKSKLFTPYLPKFQSSYYTTNKACLIRCITISSNTYFLMNTVTVASSTSRFRFRDIPADDDSTDAHSVSDFSSVSSDFDADNTELQSMTAKVSFPWIFFFYLMLDIWSQKFLLCLSFKITTFKYLFTFRVKSKLHKIN